VLNILTGGAFRKSVLAAGDIPQIANFPLSLFPSNSAIKHRRNYRRLRRPLRGTSGDSNSHHDFMSVLPRKLGGVLHER
jgi:hypothetical protein